MGTGIGIVAGSVAGYNVTIVDPNQSSLSKAEETIKKWCKGQVAMKKLTEESSQDLINRITFSGQLNALYDTDFVIEAAKEDFEVKRGILQGLAQTVPDHAILASNTSSISISKLGGVVPDRADKVIGMHFSNPALTMKLVQVAASMQTSEETLATTLAVAKSMKKQSTQARDVPGFITNRILMPYINEAAYALYEDIMSKEDIDKTMKLATNVVMGPLAMADFIGLDTVLASLRNLNAELNAAKY